MIEKRNSFQEDPEKLQDKESKSSVPPLSGNSLKKAKELEYFSQGFDSLNNIRVVFSSIKNVLLPERHQALEYEIDSSSLDEILEKIKNYHNQINDLKNQIDFYISQIEQSVSALASGIDL